MTNKRQLLGHLGRLSLEIWRAVRLVLDTGIHHKKWSREQAITYLTENTPNPEGDISKAIERYVVYPGQATAYMIGKLKIMELRSRAQKALGSKFRYGRFHDAVLKSGPVPLTVLEERIAAREEVLDRRLSLIEAALERIDRESRARDASLDWGKLSARRASLYVPPPPAVTSLPVVAPAQQPAIVEQGKAGRDDERGGNSEAARRFR